MSRLVVVVVVVFFALGGSACAECSESTACSLGQVCSDGVCTPVEGEAVSILSPAEVTTTAFDLRLQVRFRGAFAVLTVSRLRGDGCAPFVPAQVTLFGDDDQNLEQEVVVRALSSVGDFELVAHLDVNGRKLDAQQEFHGPPPGADIGGAVFQAPVDGEVNVVDAPWQPLQAELEGGRVSAFVAPSVGAPTPRVVVAEGQNVVDAFVPLVRGPQVVWLERDDGVGGIRRCGRGLLGGPLVDDAGALEIALLTDAPEPGWLGLSVRVQDPASDDVVCDSDVATAVCQHELFPLAPAAHNAEVLRVNVDNGVVEVAAVPLVVSGPVDARVRVSRAGQHEGFFGPFPIFPEQGQAWFAGRVIVEAGQVVGLVAVDEVSVGAPW